MLPCICCIGPPVDPFFQGWSLCNTWLGLRCLVLHRNPDFWESRNRWLNCEMKMKETRPGDKKNCEITNQSYRTEIKSLKKKQFIWRWMTFWCSLVDYLDHLYFSARCDYGKNSLILGYYLQNVMGLNRRICNPTIRNQIKTVILYCWRIHFVDWFFSSVFAYFCQQINWQMHSSSIMRTL